MLRINAHSYENCGALSHAESFSSVAVAVSLWRSQSVDAMAVDGVRATLPSVVRLERSCLAGTVQGVPDRANHHLLTVLRYIEQNPVRATLVGRAEAWCWSSARVWNEGGLGLIMELVHCHARSRGSTGCIQPRTTRKYTEFDREICSLGRI